MSYPALEGSVLESEILGRQAQLGATEDSGRPLGIVAGVCSHGMDIAPGALQRVIEKDTRPPLASNRRSTARTLQSTALAASQR